MLKFTVLSCFLAVTVAVAVNHPPFETFFEWDVIQYDWPSESDLALVEKNKEYIEANNSIAGIKVWKNEMYLTLPRWRSGIPVTLAVISLGNVSTPDPNNTSPLLRPYPNWDMQNLGDCTAFQSVSSMEIDPLGRMWVIDSGRTETLNVKPVTKCPARLVILDLENNGAILRTYVFDNKTANTKFAYLNDIVLDHDDGGMAYISDSSSFDPGIIVFSLKNNVAWKVRHDSMKFQTEAVSIKVGNTTVRLPGNVDGIALSPPGPDRQLYYSPLSCFHMYSIAVSVLKNSSLTEISNYDVVDLGRKRSQTGGMMMSNQGFLYVAFLADDAIAMWDSKNNPTIDTSLKKITEDHGVPQWPETFAIDEDGRLWCVTNSFQNFFANRVNISVMNYRVILSSTEGKNYQYFENGTAPELPSPNEAADPISLASSGCFIITLLFLAR